RARHARRDRGAARPGEVRARPPLRDRQPGRHPRGPALVARRRAARAAQRRGGAAEPTVSGQVARGAAGVIRDCRSEAGAVIETRTASIFGRWIRHSWRPAPGDPLGTAVREIVHWGGRADRSRERLFPGPTIELVVHVGAPHAMVADGSRSPLPAACVSGLQDSAATIEAPAEHTSVLCIRLRPPGAYS